MVFLVGLQSVPPIAPPGSPTCAHMLVQLGLLEEEEVVVVVVVVAVVVVVVVVAAVVAVVREDAG